jgi:hypothetical protein
MRAHGVPDWPDPTIGPGGKPRFDLLDLHTASRPGFTAGSARHAQLRASGAQTGRRDPSPGEPTMTSVWLAFRMNLL